MLAFSHVRFFYQGAATAALSDVSFTIERAQRVAILGANGSGKSTLARLANGLLLPTDGTVCVNGMPTSDGETLRALRQSCGVVMQNPDTQIVSTTVFDEVAFGPQNLGLPVDEIHARVELALEAVGLGSKRARDPNSLSGGEKQRLVIAGVCAMQPDFVVFDEPTSMLDRKGRAEVLSVIKDLQRTDHGILYITHRLEEALDADMVLVLDEGCVLFYDTVAEFERREDLGKRFRVEPAKRQKGRQKGTVHVSFVSQKTHESSPFVSSHESSPFVFEQQETETDTLVLENVSYTYSEGTTFECRALEEINLTVQQGSVILVQGPTGSGKSTLLRIAAGLLEPTGGTASLKNAKKTSKIEPGTVGMVFQHPESQLFAHTVFDDIAFGPRNIGLVSTHDEAVRVVQEACALVGLDYERFSQRSPFTLSGGEARRVALAGILAMSPRFMLLDEPTAGLDAQGYRFVASLINSLADRGVGVVIVSHDVEFFASLASTVIELSGGKKVSHSNNGEEKPWR